MNDYPIVETLRLDPLPTATMVEMVVGDYLCAPEAGIYFKGKLDPVMRHGLVYHQHKLINKQKSSETFVVKLIEDLDPNYPVLDLDGSVVVTPNQIPFLAYMPVLPVLGLKIVESTVRGVLEFYGTGHNSPIMASTVDALYSGYIAPNVLPNEQLRDHVLDQITGIVAQLRAQVREFCGEDRWIVHFFNERRGTMIIEKSIDWRIMEYHRLTRTRHGK